MTSTTSRILFAAALFAMGASAVQAHHSFAMYDTAQLITLNGTIKELQWTNPHAIVWVIDGPTPGKEPVLWALELPTSPGNLSRQGWTKRSLNPGDRVIVEFNPLRNGQHGGSFKKATLVDTGQVLNASPTAPANPPASPAP